MEAPEAPGAESHRGSNLGHDKSDRNDETAEVPPTPTCRFFFAGRRRASPVRVWRRAARWPCGAPHSVSSGSASPGSLAASLAFAPLCVSLCVCTGAGPASSPVFLPLLASVCARACD
eukprot:scaffold13470_cov116-Isochrysis_galbana.AAC.4